MSVFFLLSCKSKTDSVNNLKLLLKDKKADEFLFLLSGFSEWGG